MEFRYASSYNAIYVGGGHRFRQFSQRNVQSKHKILKIIILFLICVVATINNPVINLSIRSYGTTGFCGYCLFLIASISESAFLMLLFSSFPRMKILSYIGKHTMTYMCLQIFTLGVSEVILGKFKLNNTVIGWNGIIFTIIIIGIFSAVLDSIKDDILLAKYL